MKSTFIKIMIGFLLLGSTSSFVSIASASKEKKHSDNGKHKGQHKKEGHKKEHKKEHKK